MRNLYIGLVAGIFFLCLSGCNTRDSGGSTPSDAYQKPNIIYVLADQWRAQATGYSGDPNLLGKTPNLDAMANRGIY